MVKWPWGTFASYIILILKYYLEALKMMSNTFWDSIDEGTGQIRASIRAVDLNIQGKSIVNNVRS